MQLARRFISWTTYLGFLAAVAWVAFQYVRHSPRCTISGQLDFLHLWPDGSRLATIGLKFPGNLTINGGRGPLKIWDAGTGRLIHEFLGDVELRTWDISPDGRRIAVFEKDGALRIIDWNSSEERRCAEPAASSYGLFSARGRWLYAVAMETDETVIHEMSTRQVRLRMHEAPISFSPDERWVFSRKRTEDDFPVGPVSAWDVTAARKVATIPSDAIRKFIPFDERLDISSDGRAIGICVQAERILDDGIIRHRAFEVWSLPDGKKRFRYDLPVIGVHDFRFAPDSRSVAVWLSYDNRPSQLVVLDTNDGRKTWQAPVLNASGGKFSPDGSLFLLHQGIGNYVMRVLDAASGQELWQQPSTGWGTFAGNSVVLDRHANDSPLQILDARTGEPKWTEPRPGVNKFPSITPDGRHLVIEGLQSRGRQANFWEKWLDDRWPQLLGEGLPCALVVESDTGRELCRVQRRRVNGLWHTAISDDGGTLVAVELVDGTTGTHTLDIWDVHPHRAYAWSLAIVAALMVAMFTLSRLLRAWRNRSKPVRA